MSQATEISWTNYTWNPVRARNLHDVNAPTKDNPLRVIPAGKVGYHCERISPGCQHCYACAMNGRTLPAWGTGLDFNRQSRDKVEIFLDETELLKPLSWKKPRKVFVCSMTDLFAEFVPDEMIDRAFAVMALCPQHTFQVLTKRAERMRKYLNGDCLAARITAEQWAIVEDRVDPNDRRSDDIRATALDPDDGPLPNVHLGVSVEDQQRADERIPHLLATPAAVRWVSYEPALGPVDFRFPQPPGEWVEVEGKQYFDAGGPGIDWIVVGGESGHGARPFDIAWARSTVQQGKMAGVPVFVKQLGADPREGNANGNCRNLDCTHPDCAYVRIKLKDRKGADMEEWAPDLRVREYPVVVTR